MMIGEAGSGWTTFGMTNGNGVVTANIPLLSGITEFHLREVLQPGYIPFTYGNS